MLRWDDLYRRFNKRFAIYSLALCTVERTLLSERNAPRAEARRRTR